MGFRGIQALVEREEQRRGFEAALLPESEREALCRSLLAEFGVTRIHKRGPELIHGCVLPFGQHTDQDRNPTASLNFQKLVYKCVGSCDAGGGLLWFIGLCRDTSGTEARAWLDKQTGSGGEEQSLASLLQFFDAVYDKKRDAEAPIPRMSPAVLNPWLSIHPYLTEVRHIPEANLMRFLVGYGKLPIYLGNSAWVDSERVVVPHFWKGDLVGWQSRRLLLDGTPKWASSPDFPKDQTIFNYDPKVAPVLVEAPLSVVAKSHVCSHMEATFGASVTDRQIRLLSMHPEVTLFFDNDDAGWKATKRVAEALEPYSIVRVVDNPWAADPADLSDEEVRSLVADAVLYPLWKQPVELKKVA